MTRGLAPPLALLTAACVTPPPVAAVVRPHKKRRSAADRRSLPPATPPRAVAKKNLAPPEPTVPPCPVAGPSYAGYQRLVLVAQAPGDAVARDRAVQARRGESVRLYPVLVRGRGAKRRYYSAAPAVILGRRRLPPRLLRPFSALGGAARPCFRWYRVEPHQHHVATPSPNRGLKTYSNARLLTPRYGAWIGYDTLEYFASALPNARGATLTVTRATPSSPALAGNRGLGTMRYKVTAQLGGDLLATRGKAGAYRRGIGPDVLRISFRAADDLVGYLTSYFNVPNVFGSAGPGSAHQTERYQGADCADVITGAARRAGALVPYTYTGGLHRYAPAVSKRLWLTERGFFALGPGGRLGAPAALRFGRDVRRGDIMLIKYQETGAPPNGRTWDHVGVVVGDAGVNGALDAQDPIIHVGEYTLVQAAVGSQGPAIVQFLRFHPRYQRAFRWHQRQLRRRRGRP